MPADYLSTARALALPPSPLESTTSPSFNGSRPPWSRSGSGGRRSSSIPFSTSEAATLRDQVINYAKRIWRRVGEAWRVMNFWQRVGVVGIVLVALTLGIGLMIMTGRLFLWLGPMAEKWESSKLAVVVLWFAIVLVSFPPLVGWTTLATICGFIFGLWKGWLLAATATVVGSTGSFIVSRSVLSDMVNRLMERDKRFAALALTLKYDGLKLLCMIRLCPLPYSICNGAVSTFPTVQPLMYGLATAIITPKLLVPSFIGNRLRILSEKNEEMSAGSKAVNVISIVVSIAIGISTGIYIYRRTVARAKELEAKERADIRRSLQADHAARRPHRAFSEDADTNAAASSLARDEEERIGFGFNDDADDDDHVDLDLDEDEDGSSDSDRPNGRTRPYRDEFTDNESVVFKDGDGSDSDTIGLHSHRRGSQGH